MSDVFEEVEENLRAEKWSTLARKWWPALAGAVAVAVLAVGGIWFLDARKGWTGAEASQAYQRGIEALEGEDSAAAEAAFTEAGDAGNPAYRALSLMQLAALRAAEDEMTAAVALLDEAAEVSREPMLSDIARLKAAWLLMDTGSLEDITARLSPLTEDGRPFRYQAREALALARLQHGQVEAAQQQFQALSLELDVPESLRQRAQVASAMIESGVAEAIPAIIEAAARAAETAQAEASAPGAPVGPDQPSAPGQPPVPTPTAP